MGKSWRHWQYGSLGKQYLCTDNRAVLTAIKARSLIPIEKQNYHCLFEVSAVSDTSTFLFLDNFPANTSLSFMKNLLSPFFCIEFLQRFVSTFKTIPDLQPAGGKNPSAWKALDERFRLSVCFQPLHFFRGFNSRNIGLKCVDIDVDYKRF